MAWIADRVCLGVIPRREASTLFLMSSLKLVGLLGRNHHDAGTGDRAEQFPGRFESVSGRIERDR